MLYLDTSAVVKLVRREPETDALADWLDDHQPTPWVSSTLVEVELPRALRRTDSSLLTRVPAVIARIARYDIDDVVRAAAAAFPDPELRCDAIHLATATAIFARSLIAFVCYDQHLLSAATAARLPVQSPGTESPRRASTRRASLDRFGTDVSIGIPSRSARGLSASWSVRGTGRPRTGRTGCRSCSAARLYPP